MKSLTDLRGEIDALDRELTRLLVRRFALTDQVAEAKRATVKPVLDSSRESAVLDSVAAVAGPDLASEVRTLYVRLFELSRARQERLLSGEKA